ncbi:transformation system protein [Halarcobacter ebronensis]|uniref:Transformation system protein n=1 Tax=Halarcobacter ebronensis TaxID=1462615 RepID=A0A4Q0YGC8_9BACT|nr:GspE/PulE family protein [Halarcobacter ebronensis]RXJ69652.1 transformation system protein [Halarcobacter ebronensis]
MNSLDLELNYEFISKFNIQELQNSLIVPLSKEGIFIKCLFCSESNYSSFNTLNLIRTKELTKEQILFFLSDIEFRTKLYSLASASIVDKNSKQNHIESFFKNLIEKAIALRVSDIHLESMESVVSIRFRIDGKLKVFYIFQNSLQRVLSSYIKMLCRLDITQNRVPLDGSFSFYLDEKKFDFRVSTLPTIYGESIVIRVLDNQSILKDIKELGFNQEHLKNIEEIQKLNSGLVLITGPTGSGKSTTLYSIIKGINKEDKKIITVEDPVEYKLRQVQQVEVNDELNISFKEVLKNILRQDPDIILIGEIRDKNSLDIALQASLTGHLVFASIHANSAVETLSRLFELNSDKYLLSLTLKYIISQRLVLNICQTCKKQGCKICNYSGFYKRSCIAEILKIDEELSSLILKNGGVSAYLKSIKFKTIVEDGMKRVDSGITTLEEVYRVVNA